MYIKINDIKIYYEEENPDEEEVVLIVHGWGASIKTMRPVINTLKHKYRVISMELPGHGNSELPSEVMGTFDFSNIILNFIASLGLKKIIYLGHSYGGKCGIEICSRNEHPIKKLVLVDASGIKDKLDIKTRIRISFFKFAKKAYILMFGKQNLDKFYKKFGSEDYKNANGIMRNILVRVVNEDLTNNLNRISVPTLIIWGKNDLDTPLWMGETMRDKIPHSTISVLDGGHYSYLDDIIGFRNAILPFLED